MRIIYSKRSISDLAEIAEYIRPRNRTAAGDVGAAIRATISRIAQHPLSGRLQEDGSRKAVVLPYGYLVFYDAGRMAIEILAIQHGARQRPTQDT